MLDKPVHRKFPIEWVVVLVDEGAEALRIAQQPARPAVPGRELPWVGVKMDDLPLASVSSWHPSPRSKGDSSPTRAAMRASMGRGGGWGGTKRRLGTNHPRWGYDCTRMDNESATATLIRIISPCGLFGNFDAIIICPRILLQGVPAQRPSVRL